MPRQPGQANAKVGGKGNNGEVPGCDRSKQNKEEEEGGIE